MLLRISGFYLDAGFQFINNNITRRFSSRGLSMAIRYRSIPGLSALLVEFMYCVVADYSDQSLRYLCWITSTILGVRDP